MLVLTYDHSFEGFLTAVFKLYADYGYGKKQNQSVKIVKSGLFDNDLFIESAHITTNIDDAQRVLTKLEKLIGSAGVNKLIWAFLSEDVTVEACLLGVIAYALQNPRQKVLNNYAHSHVMQLAKLVKSVGRERHRMLAFVRFEKMQNGLFFARVEPDFNVLPLISGHFRRRYRDQPWAIFDLRRSYGVYYDLHSIQLISDLDRTVFSAPEVAYTEDEIHYQLMWQGYFKSANIAERKNSKLHLQQLPKRYWQYLTEKKLIQPYFAEAN